MLHDLDLVSVHEVRSKVDKAYRTWRSSSEARMDSVVEAVPEAGCRSAGDNALPQRNRRRRSPDLFLKNDARAIVAQGGKMYIGPRTIVTPGAWKLAGSHEVLVLAQR